MYLVATLTLPPQHRHLSVHRHSCDLLKVPHISGCHTCAHMDEKERDIYMNNLTHRATGARTFSSPTPTEAT
jgi:hypothetical protein